MKELTVALLHSSEGDNLDIECKELYCSQKNNLQFTRFFALTQPIATSKQPYKTL